MDTVKAIADLIKAIAWPAVALTAILLFRSHIRSMTDTLSRRIVDADKIKLKIGSVALDLAHEISRAPAAAQKEIAAPEDIKQHFDELVRSYDELSIVDEVDRVAERQKLSGELGRLAEALSISRSELANRPEEGAMVTLATLAINSWMENDLNLLCKIASKAQFNFTRYRIVLGLLTSLARNPSENNVRSKAEAILLSVESTKPVSPSLQRLIDKTRTVVVTLDDAFG
ncbi:MAG: hypothetical protein K5905_12145 [Roseibium sp.]|uniref:hypothetical protein n=1 Tax=Roseibium sp. TaxID=1936156 RepID=UPI00261D57C6|nr:hypothetical protein [Roseibium sp.]MCV0426218.1 hypothetical protein [Roseibium sp.]